MLNYLGFKPVAEYEDINKPVHTLPIMSKLRSDCNEENLNKMFYINDKKLFREYQFNIIRSSLLTNTLVCLPTGLGKTFIASTIMYNFHLWFEGKIFFFAPTKPLVNQQKEAFMKMFPFLSNLIKEINGTISKKQREQHYRKFKIFFMTPQTLDNDLTHYIVDTSKISLLIFDEAHRAQKNFAYTNIVTKISQQSPSNLFRIVGLSASPGSTREQIQNVIDGLKIKQVELRTEQDPDIKPYIFDKEIKIVEVQSSYDVERYKNLVESLITARVDVLKKFKIVDANVNVKYLGVGKLLEYQNNFKNKKDYFEREIGPMMIKEIYQTFSLLFQLFHCKKMLVTQGIETFKESIKKIDGGNEKTSKVKSANKFTTPMKMFNSAHKFQVPLSTAKKNLVESSEFKTLKSDLLSTRDNTNDTSSHPKLMKLAEVLKEYNKKIQDGSKVIIFTQFKESAKEVNEFVSNELNGIKFSIFTGQDKGFKQKDQLEVLRKFREGQINVLIATCVAEEGLDIGEVDLIICYDMVSTSPIKMIQRFGRTGRKRNGVVIVLASKGEEKNKYFKSLYRMKGINKELRSLKNFENNKIKLYQGLDNILVLAPMSLEEVEYVDISQQIAEEIADEMSDDCPESEDEDQEGEETYFQEEEKKKILLTPLQPSSKMSKNIQPLLSFKIFNKKTDSGKKYSTNKLNDDQECFIEISKEYNDYKSTKLQPCVEKIEEDSPIHLQDIDIELLLKDNSTNKKEEEKLDSCHSTDDLIKNLENNEDLINQLFKSENEKENDKENDDFDIDDIINNVIGQRQIFKEIPVIGHANIDNMQDNGDIKRKFSNIKTNSSTFHFENKKIKFNN